MLIFEHTIPVPVIVAGLIIALAAGIYSYWKYAPRNPSTMGMALLYVLLLGLLGWCLLLPGMKTSETRRLKPERVDQVDAQGFASAGCVHSQIVQLAQGPGSAIDIHVLASLFIVAYVLLAFGEGNLGGQPPKRRHGAIVCYPGIDDDQRAIGEAVMPRGG